MMKIPATFDGYSSRADGSMGLRFTTQEASPADLGELHSHVRLFGFLLFSENDIQSGDVPKEQATDNKTPSKRLRDVLFVLYTQEGSKGEFETYYRTKMETLITFVKGKLEPE